jgi:hypothetical protein
MTEPNITESDSIIVKSSKNIQVSDTVQKKSDLATEKKVAKVITEIRYLTKYVDRLKVEKLELFRELTLSKENVRVDTVYIETKKNFWGKEKTTVNSKTDTTFKEKIDTIVTENQVIDTLKLK